MSTVSLTHENFGSAIVDNPLVLVDFWAGYRRPSPNWRPRWTT
ncbi:thioredoxin TrxB1 [Mycobacterium bohemicum DSM 44277]|uniref:Thioredoxin TrxB1 n=1 Tax=Mycobacterium bohemicum DSM 44277 TaxID=1236609 RepID=A0A0U0W403_MYCBE|nr:hypothetical protein [Mycobacterium bohemicum]CPR06617.1 thioredoxin TrxB1 [Mycobacterium bohemicum DSM 44277]